MSTGPILNRRSRIIQPPQWHTFSPPLTDVKSYYASIDHFLLLDRLAAHIKDKAVLNLIGRYLRRTAERGGEFWDYEKGISLGCPLSPLIGAFFLNALDQRMAKSGLFYVRFMDDILVLSPTRWKLRKAVKAVNEVLGSLRMEKHPDKTFIGRSINSHTIFTIVCV